MVNEKTRCKSYRRLHMRMFPCHNAQDSSDAVEPSHACTSGYKDCTGTLAPHYGSPNAYSAWTALETSCHRRGIHRHFPEKKKNKIMTEVRWTQIVGIL